MREVRRERIRELIGMLEYIQERVEQHLLEEQEAFDVRSSPSKETDKGKVSGDAVFHLEEAATAIDNAIDHMRTAVDNDNSRPEPDPVTINRRGF